LTILADRGQASPGPRSWPAARLGCAACRGVMACLVTGTGVLEDRRAKTTGSRARRYRREVPIREGQLWAAAPSARPGPPARAQAQEAGRASGSGGDGGRISLLFWGAGFWESKAFGFLLLLAENYNQTTNDPTTETQSAQRTHRDFLRGIPGGLSGLTILAMPRAGLARSSLVARCPSGLHRSSSGLACLALNRGQEDRSYPDGECSELSGGRQDKNRQCRTHQPTKKCWKRSSTDQSLMNNLCYYCEMEHESNER